MDWIISSSLYLFLQFSLEFYAIREELFELTSQENQ